MGLIGQPGALLHRLAVLRKLNLASKIEGPMKALLGAMIAGIILLATKAVAGPGEDAAAVVDQWATTYSANDRDALVRLYATDALLFGTTEKTPVRGTERIRDYFVALEKGGRRNTIQDKTAFVLSDTAVVVAGSYDFARKDQDYQPRPSRFTMLIVKRADQWLILHHHSSPRAEVRQ
jgi:uncharacterized protein (TIGR02246 family)